MIVADTHMLACLHLPDECTVQADMLLQRDSDRAAPVLWRSELRDILAGYMRRRALSFEQAHAVQAEAEDLRPSAEYEVDSQHVLALVRDTDCLAYDCKFVALATRLGVKRATMNTKPLRAFPEHAVALILS